MLLNYIFIAVLLGFPTLSLAEECERVAQDLATFDQVVSDKKADFAREMASPQDKEWVKRKITHMVDVDQYLRETVMNLPWDRKYSEEENKCFWRAIDPRWQSIDGANTQDLRELMMIYDWFRISEFGAETSQNAWLLAQHADLDRPFQKEVLARLEKLYPSGEVLPRSYAFLYDRVTWYGDGRPQRYATQGQCQGPSNWQPHPTEDLEGVDARRKAMGIESLAETKQRLDVYCH